MIQICMTELYHHGIKGQRWGVRRYQNPDGTLTAEGKRRYFNSSLDERSEWKTKAKNGDILSLTQEKHNSFQKLIAKGIPAANKNMMNTKIMKIKVNDKTVGDIQLFQESRDSVNVVWLGVNSKERGKGYGTTALKEALKECKKLGYKQFTLEVPGNSPDARHIYEKLGFKVTGEVTSADEDLVWDGLTAMKLDLTKYSER